MLPRAAAGSGGLSKLQPAVEKLRPQATGTRRVDWPFVGGIGYTPLSLRGPVAQLGARLNGIQEVTGSIPVRSTTFHFPLNRLQVVERPCGYGGSNEVAAVERHPLGKEQLLEPLALRQ